MKLNKKKVTALALAVCLIAILSFGSLAWFTDDDSVTNDFMIAGSEDDDPEDIFSVDVWEEGDDEEDDGLTFEDILPGDTLTKVAHVKNTGSYDQYIRVKIVVSEADVWQDVYKANLVPVTEFVNVDLTQLYGMSSAVEGENFVYYLYYNDILKADDKDTAEDETGDIVIFNEAYISGHLTKELAFAMGEDGFQITVTADAVQTEHVGDNVYEAFKTVGMEVPVNTAYVSEREDLIDAFLDNEYIVLTADITNMYAAHRIVGTEAELYLSGHTLETASGDFNAVGYGVTLSGNLTISGYGSLEFGTLGAQVESLTVEAETVTARRPDRIVDSNGNQIILP